MLPALWTRAPVQLQQEHEAFACHMATWWEVRETEGENTERERERNWACASDVCSRIFPFIPLLAVWPDGKCKTALLQEAL